MLDVFETDRLRAERITAGHRVDLRRMDTLTLPDHDRSRRVMAKAGLTYERDVMHAGLAHVLYRRRHMDQCIERSGDLRLRD
jgi:hypothetical protein